MPAHNQTDNFVFESSEPGKTVFVMLVNNSPKAEPGKTFATDALYNIHVADDAGYKTGHTFSLRFTKNSLQLMQLDTPNDAVGTMGKVIAQGAINSVIKAKDGVKLWAGIAKDPFYGNSPGLHQWRVDLAKGIYDKDNWAKNGKNSIFQGRQVGAIVLEVPNSMLGSDIKLFATTAVQRSPGKWEQVQYSANPLFSHAMLLDSEALKESHDRSRPTMQTEEVNAVAARALRCTAITKSQKDPVAYSNEVVAKLVPDVIEYKPGSKASYAVALRNGRTLDDDGMGVILSLACGMPVDQAIQNPKLYQASFPYVLPVTAK